MVHVNHPYHIKMSGLNEGTTLESLAKYFSGKGGSFDEGESHVVDANSLETISVFTNRSDLPKIVKRCGNKIRSWRGTEENGVMLEVERSAFRGISYAFKITQ